MGKFIYDFNELANSLLATIPANRRVRKYADKDKAMLRIIHRISGVGNMCGVVDKDQPMTINSGKADYVRESLINSALDMLCFLAYHGWKIYKLDSVAISMAPVGLADSCKKDGLYRFVRELVDTLTMRTEEEAATLEVLKMNEREPENQFWIDAVVEAFSEIEYPEDVLMRTVDGFETYLMSKRFIPCVCAIAAWLNEYCNESLGDVIWYIIQSSY